MTPEHLQRKLYQPRRRFRDVLRPRLIRLLDDAVREGPRPIRVRAADGAGKTTALASWAARLELPVAWLTFAADDDDPARVLRLLVEALSALRPECGKATCDALNLDRPPPLGAMVDQLLGQLAADELQGILVLDDVHHLRDAEVAAILERIGRDGAGTLHVVLSGAGSAPDAGEGPAVAVDDAALAFDESEVREFLDQTADLALSDPQLQALVGFSRGHAGSLQIATQALVHARDRDEFARYLSGGPTLDEVIARLLRRLPEPLREFVRQTAILDRYRDTLCDAVTGGVEGRLMIQRLDRMNLLVEALDDQHEWFRTHPVLAIPLRTRLADEHPEQARALHRRAATWHAGQGDVLAAVRHVRQGGDAREAAAQVQRAIPALMSLGEWTTVRGWLERAGDAALRENLGLRAAQSWCRLLDGEAEAVEDDTQSILQETLQLDPTEESVDLQGQVGVMQATLALQRGEPRIAVELAERSAELLSADNLWARRRIPTILGPALLDDGDLAGAEQAFLETERVGRYLDDVWIVVTGLCQQAGLRVLQGELRGADVLYQNAGKFTGSHHARRFGPSAQIDIGQADLHWHRSFLDHAEERVEAAFEVLEQWEVYELWARAWCVQARIRRSRGALDAAGADLQRGRDLADHEVTPWTRTEIRVEQARLWLTRGELDEVEAWAAELGRAGREAALLREMEDLAVARLHLAQERFDEALALLSRLEQDAAAGRRRGRVIEIRVLQALGRYGQGRHEKALSRLGRALRRALRERMVQVFLDEGEPMVRLLEHGVERNIWVRPELQPFAQALLERCTAARS